MAWVKVGIENPIEVYPDDTVKELPGRRMTFIDIDPETPVSIAIVEVLDALKKHLPEGKKPLWVDSSDEQLRDMIAVNYGLGPERVGEPKEWR